VRKFLSAICYSAALIGCSMNSDPANSVLAVASNSDTGNAAKERRLAPNVEAASHHDRWRPCEFSDGSECLSGEECALAEHAAGVCAVPCDTSADCSLPDGSPNAWHVRCIARFCMLECVSAAECPENVPCVNGICIGKIR
jgi:hypothetical protein